MKTFQTQIADTQPANRQDRIAHVAMIGRRLELATARGERRLEAAAPKRTQRGATSRRGGSSGLSVAPEVPAVAARRCQSAAPRALRIRWTVGLEDRLEAFRKAEKISVARANLETHLAVAGAGARPSRSNTGARRDMRRMPSWRVAPSTPFRPQGGAPRTLNRSGGVALKNASGALKQQSTPRSALRPAMMPRYLRELGRPVPFHAPSMAAPVTALFPKTGQSRTP